MTIDLQTTATESPEPLSNTELAIAALWSEVLQIPQLPEATDNFFAIGGNSMAMAILEYRIQEEFSIELPAGVVLGAPTLRELSFVVDAECRASRNSDATPLPPSAP